MAQQKAQAQLTIIDTTDINKVTNYYLASASNSGVTTSTSGWTTDPTASAATISTSKPYLWNYQKVFGIGPNNTDVLISQTNPTVIGHFGTNGSNGISISSIDDYYQASNSTTNPGSSGWTTSPTNTAAVLTSTKKYLWNYQVIHYSNNTTEGTYSDARIIGVYGDKGERGTSILKVTTAPTSTSGTAGGFSYSYRVSLSTVKTQSGKSEVLVGDIIEYGSNHYQVGYVDSSYVYLGPVTSIKGADGQTYYSFVKYATNSSGANMQNSPDSTHIYIGTYAGTLASPAASDYQWSLYKGSDGVSVVSVKEIYFLKRSSDSIPSAPSAGTNTTSTSTSGGVWTTVVPTYEPNGIYYTSLQTTLSSGTSPISSAAVINNALTDENYRAWEALSISQNSNENSQGAMAQAAAAQYQAEALDARLKTFFYPGDSNYPGAYAVSGIDGTALNLTNISTYGYNVAIKPASISVGYNNIKAILIDGSNPSLKFYTPSKTTQATNPSMELTSSALKFYRPGTSTVDAQLDSNGLKISNGSIVLGTTDGTSAGNVTLSNTDFTRLINNTSRSNLRLAVGQYFGVKNDGTLYASNANVAGSIRASSLYIEPTATLTDTAGLINNGVVQKQVDAYGNVINSQEWIDTYGSFFITEDSSVNADKVYYTLTGTAVETPVVDDLKKYYQLTNNTYEKTTDTSIDVSKTYYTVVGTIVNYPTDASLSSYYELNVEGVSNFLQTHISLTQEGLKVFSNEGGWSVVVSTDGVNIVDPYNQIISEFGENIQFNSKLPQKIGGASTYIQFNPGPSDDADDDSIEIVGANVFFGSQSAEELVQTVYGDSGEGGLVSTTNTLNTQVNSLTTDFLVDSGQKSYLLQTLRNEFDNSQDEYEDFQDFINKYLGDSGYIHINETNNPSLEIGKLIQDQQTGDSLKFYINLSSTELGFYQQINNIDTKVAYINDKKLYIANSEVKEEQRIGNFIWKVQSANRISFRYAP